MNNYYEKSLESMTLEELTELKDWCEICKVSCMRSRSWEALGEYRRKIRYINKLIRYKSDK